MRRGKDFLRQTVSDAAQQHRALIETLKDHQAQARDVRYRELCARHVTMMEEHQSMLDSYRRSLGDEGGFDVKEAIGSVLGMAKSAVDAVRESDFLRVVGSVVMIRQAQDTFATFAAVGIRINEPRLAEIGRRGEQDHDRMQKEFNELAREMFVEHVLEHAERGRMVAD